MTAGPATDPDAAADAVRDALALVRAGFVVDARQTCLHVQRVDEPDVRVDVFHVYFDEDGLFAFPNNKWSDTVQANVVSKCFAFGRRYGIGPTDQSAAMASPYGKS